jgi:hypothetical protein
LPRRGQSQPIKARVAGDGEGNGPGTAFMALDEIEISADAGGAGRVHHAALVGRRLMMWQLYRDIENRQNEACRPGRERGPLYCYCGRPIFLGGFIPSIQTLADIY